MSLFSNVIFTGRVDNLGFWNFAFVGFGVFCPDVSRDFLVFVYVYVYVVVVSACFIFIVFFVSVIFILFYFILQTFFNLSTITAAPAPVINNSCT